MSAFLLLFGCLVLGALVAHCGKPPANMARGLNWWVLNIALPALVLQMIPQLEFDPELWYAVAVLWLTFIGAWLVFGTLGPLLDWSRARTGCVILVTALGNTTFTGYPLILALRGKEALGVAVVSDQLGSFILLVSLAVVVASLYAGRTPQPGLIIRRVFTFPAFVALLLAIGVNVAGGWPPLVSDALAPVGATLTPVALFSVGLDFRFRRESLRLLNVASLAWGWKLVAAPALAWLLALATGVSGQIMHVGVLQAGMAPMVSAAIMAQEYELDGALANTILTIGIVLSLITVPLLNVLLG